MGAGTRRRGRQAHGRRRGSPHVASLNVCWCVCACMPACAGTPSTSTLSSHSTPAAGPAISVGARVRVSGLVKAVQVWLMARKNGQERRRGTGGGKAKGQAGGGKSAAASRLAKSRDLELPPRRPACEHPSADGAGVLSRSRAFASRVESLTPASVAGLLAASSCSPCPGMIVGGLRISPGDDFFYLFFLLLTCPPALYMLLPSHPPSRVWVSFPGHCMRAPTCHPTSMSPLQFNGQGGKVGELLENGRVKVVLDAGNDLSLKLENLSID